MSNSVDKQRQQIAIDSTHIKRKGTLKEMSSLVTYALTEAPHYLTGSILNINGGQYN